MFKRPLCEIAVGFLLGILFCRLRKWILLLSAIGIGSIMAGSFFSQKQYKIGIARVALFFLMFLLGGKRYFEEEQFRTSYRSMLEEEKVLTVQGVVDAKEYKNQQYVYYLKSCIAAFPAGNLSCNQVLFYSDANDYQIGETLIVKGKIKNWEPAYNEGNFDARMYYQTHKMDFWLKDAEVTEVYGEADQVREYLFSIRQSVLQVYRTYLEEEDSGVMATMTLGDKSLLTEEVKQLYQTAGISHILAISGLHISVIGMFLYRLLRKMRLSFLPAGCIAGIVMIFYGMLTGFGTSTIRAVAMFLLMLLAQCLGRSYDMFSALGFAALLLLWKNPYLLSDAGFMLSFFAVLGVVFVGAVVRTVSNEQKEENNKLNDELTNVKSEVWEHIKKKVCNLKETLWSGFSIQLMTLPIVAYFYYEIPVYTLLINLFVLPFMSILLFLGIAGGIAGSYFPCLAKLCFVPCHFILSFCRNLCVLCEVLPNPLLITGQPSITRITIYYIMILFIALWFKIHRKRKWFGCMACLALLFLFWQPKEQFELCVLDVGQGDGCYLQTEEGYHLFVDGGSSDVSKVGKYRILPFLKSKGIRQMDYWFVSHTDSDHISGLLEILEEGYPVANIVLAEEMEKDEAYENLIRTADVAGTELIFVKKGEVLHLGEAKVHILAPVPGEDYADKNAASLVLLYEEEDFSGIFTGDIDASSEKILLSELERMHEITQYNGIVFYKAAHHGSNGSNSAAFLETLSPEIATVSCGRENRYGHPGEDALLRMETAGADIYCTMNGGRIRVRRENEQFVVDEYVILYLGKK